MRIDLTSPLVQYVLQPVPSGEEYTMRSPLGGLTDNSPFCFYPRGVRKVMIKFLEGGCEKCVATSFFVHEGQSFVAPNGQILGG